VKKQKVFFSAPPQDFKTTLGQTGTKRKTRKMKIKLAVKEVKNG